MPTAGAAPAERTATGRFRVQRHDAIRRDGEDQPGIRGNKKKSDLLPDRSSIAMGTSAATGSDKRLTEERRGRTTTAAGHAGGGNGGAGRGRAATRNERQLAT